MDLKRLARDKGTNLKQVAEKCGIPPTTLYAISSGDTNFDNVGVNTAMKVASALGMTVEELYTGKKLEQPNNQLSTSEYELVDLYRNLNAAQQSALMEVARSMVVGNEKNQEGARRDVVGAGQIVR